MQNYVGLDKIDMSRWRSAAPNELCLEPSIRDEDSITGPGDDALPQSPATWNTGALRLFHSQLVLTAFQDFNRHSHNKFAEMQEDEQKECTIPSTARVNAWIVTVTEIFTDNRICGRHR